MNDWTVTLFSIRTSFKIHVTLMSIWKGHNLVNRATMQLQIARQHGKWCEARIDQSTAYNLSATVGGSKIQFMQISPEY